MTPEELPAEDIQRAQINAETAKIPWADLQRFFASGRTLMVTTDLDLVEVALAVHGDDTKKIAHWQQYKQVDGVSNEQARQWFDSGAEVWAVVIKPWVLVQTVDTASP